MRWMSDEPGDQVTTPAAQAFASTEDGWRAKCFEDPDRKTVRPPVHPEVRALPIGALRS